MRSNTAFARTFLDESPEIILTTVKFFETGVDEQSGIIMKNTKDQMVVMALSMRAKQPKRDVVSGTKGYVEINHYPRATEEKHDKITAGDSDKALEYEVQDMQRYIDQGHDDGQLQMSHDIAYILTSVRTSWGMKYPFDDEK